MDIPIRKATLDDAHSLALLIRETGWFDVFNGEEAAASALRVRERLQGCLADGSHTVYVAMANGGIAGYGSVHWLPYLFMAGPEGYVSELFVRESARGKGVGRELLKAIEAEAKSRGCSRLSLLNLRHRQSYERGFYIKAGWRERREAANFIRAIA